MKMKIKIALLLLLFVFTCINLCACSNKITESKNFEIINKVEHDASAKIDYSIDENTTNKFNMFAYNTALNIFNEDSNQVYSPISLYIALSMIAEGADGDTYLEIMNLLGSNDIKDVRNDIKNTVLNNDYDNDDGKLRIANSIWLHNNFSFNSEYIDELNENYMADIFRSDFSIETNKNIVKWMNDNTYNYLKMKEDDFDLTDIQLFLVNSIYFENKWREEYEKNDTVTKDFYGYNETVSASFMNHEIYGEYYLGDHFTLSCDYFKNNNKITFVLPDDGYNVDDILKDEEFVSVFCNKTKLEKMTIEYSLPKFKYKNKHILKDNLINLGLSSLFDPNACNLSKMSDNSLVLAYLNQICGIEIDEQGAKAAVITFGGFKATSIGPGSTLCMNLNKPFIYYISDSNDTVLFMGIIYNPNN